MHLTQILLSVSVGLAVTGLLICGESIWSHKQSKFSGNSVRINERLHHPTRFKFSQAIKEISLVWSSTVLLERRSVEDAANHYEPHLPNKRAGAVEMASNAVGVSFNGLGDIGNQWANIVLLNPWISRKQRIPLKLRFALCIKELIGHCTTRFFFYGRWSWTNRRQVESRPPTKSHPMQHCSQRSPLYFL